MSEGGRGRERGGGGERTRTKKSKESAKETAAVLLMQEMQEMLEMLALLLGFRVDDAADADDAVLPFCLHDYIRVSSFARANAIVLR